MTRQEEAAPPRESEPRPSGSGAPQRAGTISIVALVLDYLLLALLFNLVVPVFEMPDEAQHYFYAQHLARTGALPVQTGDYDTGGPWEQEGSQPPLYYLLAAPLVHLSGTTLEAVDLWVNQQNTMGRPALVGNENRFVHPPAREGWPWAGYALAVHLARLISTLLGALTVVCVWLVARRVLPGRDWLALAAAGLVAFNPQLLAVSATMSNDGLIIALSTAALVLLLRIADGYPEDHAVPLLAVVVGLAPLAKLSGLALVAFTLATLAGLAWRRRDGRFLLRAAGPVLIAVLVLAGWWYARNLRLYGDLTGLSHMLPESMDRNFRLDPWLRGLPAELRGLWWSTWGIFGWFTILLPTWLYTLISLLAALALAGLARAAWRRERWIDWPRLAWLLAWAAVVFASLLRWLTIAKGGHGRLVFPAIALLAVALVAGWRALAGAVLERAGAGGVGGDEADAKEANGADADEAAIATGRADASLDPIRLDRPLAIVVLVAMFGLAIYSLVGVIAPAYAQPRAIPASGIPPDAIPADVVFGDGLRLVAVQRPERVTEGEPFDVTLYWQVERPLDRDGFVALRLDQNDVRWTHDAGGYFDFHPEPASSPGQAHLSYPGQGNAPPALLPAGAADGGQVVVDRHVLTAPGLVTRDQPLAARLSVHVFDQAKDERWPMRKSAAAGIAAGTPSDAESAAAVVPDSAAESEWSTTLTLAPRYPLRFGEHDLTGTPGPHAVFANGLRLHRYQSDGGCVDPANCFGYRAYDPETVVRAAPGTAMTTGLGWAVDRDITETLSLFVHLVDASGRTVATFDGPPATYAPYPASAWRAGDELYGPITWRVPADAAPGTRYTLLAGLYRPADLARIPVSDPAGRPFNEDAVPLQTIEIAAP